MFYDPMIAKLCTHAPTRLEAIDAMETALDEFRIEGIRHNIAFLNAIMHNARFRSGAITTAFIAEEFPDGFHGCVRWTMREAHVRRCRCRRNARRGGAAPRDISGTLNGPAMHRLRNFTVRSMGDDASRSPTPMSRRAACTSRHRRKAVRAVVEWQTGAPLMRLQRGGREIRDPDRARDWRLARLAGRHRRPTLSFAARAQQHSLR